MPVIIKILIPNSRYLTKHAGKASYTLSMELLSYLRLSLHQKRKVDIASITTFWTKYHMRRDYGLLALDLALPVFEKQKLVDWKNSIKLITQIQEGSEKGYRGLLASYIMEHEPAFVGQVLDAFSATELRISWFHLKAAYIDILPEYICRQEISESIRYHDSNRLIPLADVHNVLPSNKLLLLQKQLTAFGYAISADEDDPGIPLLIKYDIPYRINQRERYGEIELDPDRRFDNGSLDLKNKLVIKMRKLSPAEVAAMPDGNYTALAEPELFNEFTKSQIKKNFNQILYHALTGKNKRGDYHHATWLMPGTILKIMDNNDIDISIALFKSFLIYLKLAVVELESSPEAGLAAV